MLLHITDRDSFLDTFLLPISKVTDMVVLNIRDKKIDTLVSTSDDAIVSAVYNDDNIKLNTTLNIPDVTKFCRILQCIDKNEFDLEIGTNNISYSSQSVRFKYHFYDDNIIPVPKLDLQKINKLEFNGEFSITPQSLTSLIKGSTIATESNKIYISTKGGEMLGELTDNSRANVDSYGIKLSEDYKGADITSVPLKFEIFRIISSMKFNKIEGKLVSSLGVFTFDLSNGNSAIKFIVSALAN